MAAICVPLSRVNPCSYLGKYGGASSNSSAIVPAAEPRLSPVTPFVVAAGDFGGLLSSSFRLK